jgi:hypothetical protein
MTRNRRTGPAVGSGTGSEDHQGIGIEIILRPRRTWRELFAPPTPLELVVIFAGGWIAALWTVVTK